MKKLAIIGGGMAGCIAGIVAANNNLIIDIFERQDEVLKKLLLTGNGRCNISNISIANNDYYTDDYDKLALMLSSFNSEEEKAFFNSLGLMLKEKNSCLYPYTGQAISVRNLLLNHLKLRNINIKTNSFISNIEKKNDGYIVNGQHYDFCILSSGGMAGVYKEQESNGYSILRGFKIPYEYCYPALVQIKCKGDFYKAIKGIRCDAKITLTFKDNEGVVDAANWTLSETGELQITENGLSGIAVFQLSRYIGILLKNKISCSLVVDLLYGLNMEAIISNFQLYKNNYPDVYVMDYLAAYVNTRIFECIFADTIYYKCKIKDISIEEFNNILSKLNNWTHFVKELNPFKNAQVSCGGLSLKYINDNFMVANFDNLFVLGEMLNVAGKCGGYNLHFATLSGYKAGNYIKELTNNA